MDAIVKFLRSHARAGGGPSRGAHADSDDVFDAARRRVFDAPVSATSSPW